MFSILPTNNHSTNEELMFIICWMLHPEVGFRAKLPDIIKYPWFTRQVDINNYDYDTVLAGMFFILLLHIKSIGSTIATATCYFIYLFNVGKIFSKCYNKPTENVKIKH